MLKSGIRKKRKFVFFRSSIFGDITLIDFIFFLIAISITILFAFFIPSLGFKIFTIIFVWITYFWLIWEAGDFKGYEIFVLWFSFIFKPKKYSLDYFSNEDEYVVYKIKNGIDINLFDTSKQEEIISMFYKFISVNDIPFKLIKTNDNFPLYKNSIYLKENFENEEEEIKKNILENSFLINKHLNKSKDDFTFFLYFKLSKKEDIDKINNNLKILDIHSLEIEKTDLEQSTILNAIFKGKKDLKEYSTYIKPQDENQQNLFTINKVNFSIDLSDFWLNALIFNPNINFVITIEKTNQFDSIKTYEKYLHSIKDRVNDSKKLSEEIDGTIKYQTSKEILEEIIIGKDILVKLDLDIITHSKNKEEHQKKIKETRSILKLHGINLSSQWYLQIQKITELLTFDKKNNYFLMPLNTFAHSYPFHNFNYIDEKGLFLGFLNDSKPFIYNPISLKNSSNFINLVIGKTGSGKTTLIKMILLIMLIKNDQKIIVVDPHNEYGVFLNHFKGNKINFDSKKIINPLVLKLNEFEDINDQINKKVLFVTVFIRILFNDNIWYEEKTLNHFSNELKTFYYSFYYEDLKNHNFNNLKEPIFEDLYNFMENPKIREGILKYFIDGIYNSFNQKSNLNYEDNFIIYNLIDVIQNPDDNLKKAFYYLITFEINSLMYANFENKNFLSIFIDETHLLFNDLKTLKIISKMIREARKFNTFIMLGSQNLTDFTSRDNEVLSSIFSNTSNIFVGKIESDQIKILNELVSEKLEKLNNFEIEHFQKDRGNFILLNENYRLRFNVEYNDYIESIIFEKKQIQEKKEY